MSDYVSEHLSPFVSRLDPGSRESRVLLGKEWIVAQSVGRKLVS